MLLVVFLMMSFSVLMDFLMLFAVSLTIALFLMPLMMVRAIDSLSAFAVRAAVVAAAVMTMSHNRSIEASRQHDGSQHDYNCFFPFL